MEPKPNYRQYIALVLGPLLAGLFAWALPALDPDQPKLNLIGGIGIWMAAWWLTEAVPLAVTALLPLVLFPATGILSTKALAPSYMDDVLMLVIGGYLVAFAMERWNLHKRIGLRIILWTGTQPPRILLGFMLATWFLSLWISNTAAILMMLPTGLAVLKHITAQAQDQADVKRFGAALMMGLAYSASLGGLGTPIGTFPNLIFKRVYAEKFPDLPEINFLDWTLFALPLSLLATLLLFGFLWYTLVRRTRLPDEAEMFREEYRKLGRWSFEEKAVMLVFCLLAVAWFTRQDIDFGGVSMTGWSGLFSTGKLFSESTLAIAASLLLFLIPSRSEKGRMLLTWEEAKGIPVETLLLFGGGFALALGFEETGFSGWIGMQLQGLAHLPLWLLIGSICLIVTLFSELASNTATATLVLPILAVTATSLNLPPWTLMVPATLAASFGFMMPVGTPPNLIAYGTGWIPIRRMVRAGLLLDLIGVVLITAFTLLFGKLCFG